MTDHDELIRRRLVAELDFEPSLDAVHLTVAVRDGVAILSGQVASLAQKEAASAAAARIAGVRAIAQEIQVIAPQDRETDAALGLRIADCLAWASALPEGGVVAEVSAGVVTLRGEVEWDHQRRSAQAIVSGLKGVVNVINLVTLKARHRPHDIQKQIEASLARHTLAHRGMRVSEKAGLVTLSGEVQSLFDREAVERMAWSVPGVGGVLNQLTVVARGAGELRD